jgi:hypothetical protein
MGMTFKWQYSFMELKFSIPNEEAVYQLHVLPLFIFIAN